MAAFNTSQVSVTSAATLILAANAANRLGAIVTNPGTTIVYLGSSSSVTSSTGLALVGSASFNVNSNALYSGAIYGITASATQTVTVAEFTT